MKLLFFMSYNKFQKNLSIQENSTTDNLVTDFFTIQNKNIECKTIKNLFDLFCLCGEMVDLVVDFSFRAGVHIL